MSLVPLVIDASFEATGGTITEDATYKYHTFTSNGNFTVLSASATVTAWVIGGGGAGNAQHSGGSWGGGGGGCANGTVLLTEGTYAVTVGAASAAGTTMAEAPDGGNSSFQGMIGYGGAGGYYPSLGTPAQDAYDHSQGGAGGSATGGNIANYTGANGRRQGYGGGGNAGGYGTVSYSGAGATGDGGTGSVAGGGGCWGTSTGGGGARGVVVIRYAK